MGGQKCIAKESDAGSALARPSRDDPISADEMRDNTGMDLFFMLRISFGLLLSQCADPNFHNKHERHTRIFGADYPKFPRSSQMGETRGEERRPFLA
jgi:hypothetical protein